jgi:rRNA-processing protein FCF1
MTAATVIAFIKAIPALKSWFDFMIAEYIKKELETIKKEHREAIAYAINQQDQRPLEAVLKNPKAGKPSGIAGTDIVNDLPRVRDNKK